jgi:hypothetical protein
MGLFSTFSLRVALGRFVLHLFLSTPCSRTIGAFCGANAIPFVRFVGFVVNVPFRHLRSW